MDLISLAAAKNYTNRVAAGITTARVEGNSIILTLVDGSEAICQLPAPKDGLNGKDGISVLDLSIDTDGSLLCHMSDGTTIDAGYVPMADVKLTDYYTKEEMDERLNNVVEDIPEVDLTNYYTQSEINSILPRVYTAQLSGIIYVDNRNYTFTAEDIEELNKVYKINSLIGTNKRTPWILYVGGDDNYFACNAVLICHFDGQSSSSDGTATRRYKCMVYGDLKGDTTDERSVLSERNMEIVINRSTNLIVSGYISKSDTNLQVINIPSTGASDKAIANKAYVDGKVSKCYTKEQTDAAIAAAITTVLEGEY